MNKIITLKEYKTFSIDYIRIKLRIIKTIIIFLILLCIFLGYFKFDKVYTNKYIVIKYEDKLLLNTNVLLEDLPKINKGKYINIDNHKYKYKIIKIDNVIDDKLMMEYKNVYINIDRDNKENDIITGNITYDKKTCFEMIYDFICEREW